VQLWLLGLAAFACLVGLGAMMLLLTRGQPGDHGGGDRATQSRAPAGHAPTDPHSAVRKRAAGHLHLWSVTAPSWFARADHYPLHRETGQRHGDTRSALPVPRGSSADRVGTRCAGVITGRAARTIRRASRRRIQSSTASELPMSRESPVPPAVHEDANRDAGPFTAPSAERDSQER
jgi:hypothetical protein